MKQTGFSYIELSITSAIFSISALGLLSLIASLTTSVQELLIVDQVRAQTITKLVDTMHDSDTFTSIEDVTTFRNIKPSELTKHSKSKQSKLLEITISSSQQGKDFKIKHTIKFNTLPPPPLSIESSQLINLAPKPEQ
ncbi:type IV pilus modification PilV family protein [Alteromonas sp. ASW11-130]|uniref:type IV pilus modification PilV family protein n=1 Tax=Alteromonas sp. ASW11-130 TaxID=3015775 RepID=UPI002241D894|nr:hypothetical protein [Alteromonas sp. ASW11-130]MCW8092919.1 hypothetical protein [Alteromonas sp. ASW11-130]